MAEADAGWADLDSGVEHGHGTDLQLLRGMRQGWFSEP
jgi:hypothetical protein